jgi:hypothetical protein
MAISFQGWELFALSIGSMVASCATAAVSAALRGLLHLAFQERVYSDESCATGMSAVVSRLSALHVFAQRREVVGGRMQPSGVVIGATFLARVECVSVSERGMFARSGMTRVRVVRPRWMPPLVPDDAVTSSDSSPLPGVIRVLRNCGSRGCGWTLRSEIASPAAMPAAAAAVARDTASRIFALHKTAGDVAQVRVILSGPPGCGKSTTARVVALLLDAVLVPGFDPSRTGHATTDVLLNARDLAVVGTHVVLSMDEFDVCYRRAVAAGALAPAPGNADSKGPPEVTDKASWNAMMDMLQFVPKVTVVMSTNLTFPELDALDPSGAMLRAGRVTQRIEMGHPTSKTPPTTPACGNNAKKNKMRRRGV